MKWLRWLWFLLATGSFIGAAVLDSAPAVIMLITVCWFFVVILMVGKKALPLATGVLVLVAFIVGIWVFGGPSILGTAKQYLETLTGRPGEIILVYVGLIALTILLIITLPVLVAQLVGKLVSRRIAPAAQPPQVQTRAVPQAQAVPQVGKPKLPDVGEP